MSRRRLTLGLVAVTAAGCAVLTPIYVGPRSDHFDGVHFHNYEPTPAGALGDAYRRANLLRRHGRWPGWVETPTDTPPPRVTGNDLRVTFVNHATVLIQTAGLNILTDPVWSTRVGPFPGIGVRRHRPPGIRFADLPTIDVVLLSHDHYDHLDIPTLRRLVARDHPRIIAGLGNAEYLAIRGVPGAVDLDWWQSEEIGAGLRIVAVPARHWSGRGIDEHDRTLWAGFVLETAGGAIYFAGDTGHGNFLELIHRRFPSVRLALLPIAPERPRAALAPRHMSAGDAVRAAHLLGAGMAVGIHFGTFRQGDDADGEAVDSLRRALLPLGGAACDAWFRAMRNGEHADVPLPAIPTPGADATERARSSAGCTR